MSKTEIIYLDVAPGAEETAVVNTAAATSFSVPGLLPTGGDSALIASLEHNIWTMNGIREINDGQRVAFWSTEISNADGDFASAPVIDITFGAQHTSVGLTLTFDVEDYCSAVNIKWYQQGSLKANEDFYPNGSVYFCDNRVESYDRVVITLQKTHLPNRRAKLNRIQFGVVRTYGMSETRGAHITAEVNPLMTELPVSTFAWTLESKGAEELLFQRRQPVEVRNDGALVGVYYVKESRRTTKKVHEIDCEDVWGALDSANFVGGVYTNKSAKELLKEVVGDKYPITYGEGVVDTLLTGAIMPGTRRAAAHQVLFAWGVMAATDGVYGIRVFNKPVDTLVMAEDEVYLGARIRQSTVVTGVRVVAHSYAADGNGNIDIAGSKYSDTTTTYEIANPNVTAADAENIVSIENATLVSASNVQSVAQRIYDSYLNRQTCETKIVWSGQKLGDKVRVPDGWGGTVEGNITLMEIKLSNLVAADCDIKGGN